MKTIFEKSTGACGVEIREIGSEINMKDYIPDSFLRKESVGLPQLSELDIMRHYKELSDRNFCIEKGFYPLGS